MSWLNISDNLSSLANNVSSFTKEVLTEANREDNSLTGDEDVDVTGDFNPALRDELLFLRSEVANKDQHIAELQEELDKVTHDFEKHTSNLKDQLLQKNDELDAYAVEANQSTAELQKQISELVLEKSRMENELAEKMSSHDTDNDSDWGNDWGGGNNDLDRSNLKEENESLSNEVSMKEIVLSSIESKLRQLSGGKHIEASDFTDWIDDYLEEMQQEREKATNLTELALYLKEEMGDTSDGDDIDLDSVYDWLSLRKEEKLVLERKITKLETTIVTVEESVRQYEKGFENFKIADFNDWLHSLSSKTTQAGEQLAASPAPSIGNAADDGSKALLMSIQAKIRDFDEEDEEFEIKDFQSWIEKVQNRLDDLEVELLNEQEIKDSEEKQRIEERTKLKELFDEKEKEISLLKVELYHSSNQNHQVSSVIELSEDNQSHLQEQFTEAVARCEALQNELTATTKQSSEKINTQSQELGELSKTNSEINLLLENAMNEKESMNMKIVETQQTVEELKKSLATESKEKSDLEQTIQTLEESRLQTEQMSANYEQTIHTLQKELNNMKTATSSTIENIEKEKEILSKTIQNMQQENVDTGDLAVQLQDASLQVKNLDSQCMQLKEVNERLDRELISISEDVENLKEMFGDGLEWIENSDLNIKSSKMASLTESLKRFNENFVALCEENTKIKDETINMELQLKNQGEVILSTQNLVHSIISELSTKVFPDFPIPTELTTPHFSEDNKALYSQYIQSCSGHVNALRAALAELKEQGEERDKDELESLIQHNELKEQITSLQRQIQSLEIENASLTTTDDTPQLDFDQEKRIQSLTEELVKVNGELKQKSSELALLQQDNEEQIATITNLENSLKTKEALLERQSQQSVGGSDSTASGNDGTGNPGGLKFGVLKRKVKELEEVNKSLQEQIEQLNQQKPTQHIQEEMIVASTESTVSADVDTTGGGNLQEEIEDLKQQVEDLNVYNAAYEREVEQLKQKINEVRQGNSTQEELQNNVALLTQQLQQYQTYATNLQSENEHFKRLNQAAMAHGSEQEVAIRVELNNQIATLTHENQHYQTEYENLRQGWIKYQQESNTYVESIQQQYQHLQSEYEKLQQQQQSSSSSFDASPTGNSNQLQEKIHNLSLLLTEKAEECVKLQQENDTLQAKLVEIQNDTSDMELIREECKQLKTMLMSKDHEETISNLQSENKQLKQELEQIQKLGVEKDNDLSDMELLREECKQLKLMLVNKDSPAEYQQISEKNNKLESTLREKDEELQQKNASMVELTNQLSDMDLVREECKQLKLMLMNNQSAHPNQSYQHLESQLEGKDEEIRQKDSIILEMQNTSADVELLRQQCEQLKSMLSEKESDSVLHKNTLNDNSFMVQVQQLEEVMKEKDDIINQLNNEILQKDHVITELRNSTSDMELLHNECRALKEMISEKERMFNELQNDLDLANDVVEQKNTDVSVKITENKLLREQMTELNEILAGKEREIARLTEEMQEAVLQDENIHLLQTEYRNVEEQLKTKEKELSETQGQLFDLETRYERVRAYEDQYQELKNTLRKKEEELSVLQLQSNENSILESDTVSLLNQELNQLKTIVYEREKQTDELNSVLEKKNAELQDFQAKLNYASEEYLTEQNRVIELQQKLQIVNNENLVGTQNDQPSFTESDSQFVYYKSMVDELTSENEEICEQLRNAKKKIKDLTEELRTLKKEKTKTDEECKELSDTMHKQFSRIQQLEELVRQNGQVNESMLEVDRKQLTDTLQNQTLRVQQLEEIVRQNEQTHKQLLESVSTRSEESAISLDRLQKEHQLLKMLISNLKTLLQMPEASTDQNLSNELSDIVQKVQALLSMIQQRDTLIQRLQTDYQTQNDNLQNDLKAKEVQLEEMKNQFDFKIKDLQSQLMEYKELEGMYQAKCAECDSLQASLAETSDMYQAKCAESELLKTSSNQSVIQQQDLSENDRLRDELAKNSHSLFEKNKECDQLKMDILKLEEKIFQHQQTLTQLPDSEQMQNQLQEVSRICQCKDQQILELQSKLEDSFAELESGKKEKAFLDQLIKEKQSLASEKEELVFQRNQLSNRIQELEVDVRHKETQSKEIEVKTKRELERLRNHLMMIEENHTKDVIECQDREDALRKELDETKDTLGKKSIILQDSSKQFQDHVGTLEEQLHAIAAQRDTNTLNLEKCREKIEVDAAAIFNLQNALEQLQREKDEQYEYMLSVEKRKESEYEQRIEELLQEQEQAKSAMSEASLAVQGITKLQLELEQKDRELKISNGQIAELTGTLKEREMQYTKILQVSDGKMDKSLIRNLLLKYFQSPEDKRADIVKVIGGLLGLSHDQINEIGSGAAPSKVGGWISNVWGYAATPKKSTQPPQPSPASIKVDPNQSFSEMFIKFLENESAQRNMVDSSASLTNAASAPMPSNMLMLSSNPPDILHFNKKPDDLNSSSTTIPAPGQEIPRVHTHHAQSTLKNLLS